MTLMRLDPGGRLVQLVVVPRVEAPPASRAPDWSALLTAAGFEPSAWQTSPPRLTPPVYADSRAAWEGTWPGRSDVPVRLEAAAVDGRPVFFEALFPWTPPPRTDPGLLTSGERAALIPVFVVAIALLVTAAVMASRNLRAGRGDRRGAWRLSAFVFIALVLSWFFGERHVATVGEVTLVVMALAWAFLVAGACWLGYIAAEPFLRRRWPRMLVSWMRVLAGDVRDPLVGRDLLVGCIGGTVMALMSLGGPLLPVVFGRPPDLVPADVLGVVYDFRTAVPLLIWRAPQAVIAALSLAFGLLLFRLVLPSQRSAMGGFVVVSSIVLALPAESVWIAMVAAFLFGILYVSMLRIGLLAAVTTLYTSGLFLMFPITADLDAWYAGAGVGAALVFSLLALFGFVTSLGGRSAFGRTEGV